jgi:serine/threonine protein kinase
MKRYDFDTDTLTPMFNVWGPDRQSQAGRMSAIFDHGDCLGDIEIDSLIRVFRTSALYSAKRKVLGEGRGAGLTEQKVLLKVAHNNASDFVKREATVLAKLAQDRLHPMLPKVLPPYQFDSGEQRAYGKTTFQGETKYFIVYEFSEGEFLRDMLIRNPQPWNKHAGWIGVLLADVIYFLHVKAQHLLLNLSPESLMVRIDVDGIPRPMLMDLTMASEPEKIDLKNAVQYILPSYIAPELLDGAGQSFGAQTDVYGIGLLVYEMLTGHPAYPFRLRAPEDIRASVRAGKPGPLNRADLSIKVTETINKAMHKAYANRHEDVRVLGKELRTLFGEVPAERPKRRFPRRLVIGVAALVFFGLLWMALVVITQANQI